MYRVNMAILKYIICSSRVMKKCDNVHWSSKNVMKYTPKISEGLKYYMDVCSGKRGGRGYNNNIDVCGCKQISD
jgi:hypothetical protein